MLRQSLIIVSLLSSLMLPPFARAEEAGEPLSTAIRVRWFAKATVGPGSLSAGLVSAGWGTARNRPREYGPHWEGFGKRYGTWLSTNAASNALEAGLGAAWGEDPRYVHSIDKRFWNRIGHAGRLTFMAYRANGTMAPAYARYSGMAGSNFLSNTWRVQSENTVGAAVTRTALGFAGKFASNVFEEFFMRGKKTPESTRHP